MRLKSVGIVVFFLAALCAFQASLLAAFDELCAQEPNGVVGLVSDTAAGSGPGFIQRTVVIRPPEPVPFGAPAVADIPMTLTLPTTSGPHRAVILIHGHNGNRGGIASILAAPLAQAGFASVAYDLPDHGARAMETGVSGTFWDDPVNDYLRMTVGVRRSVMDARWIVDYLQSRPDIIDNGIGSAGISLGGYLNTIVLDVEERISAGIINASGSNQQLRDDLIAQFGQGFFDVFLAPYFPDDHAADTLNTAVLQQHGSADGVVPLADAQALFAEFATPDKTFQLFEGAGHNLNGTSATADGVAFFDANLAPEPTAVSLLVLSLPMLMYRKRRA